MKNVLYDIEMMPAESIGSANTSRKRGIPLAASDESPY
jgi:hypothetical protein